MPRARLFLWFLGFFLACYCVVFACLTIFGRGIHHIEFSGVALIASVVACLMLGWALARR